MIRLKTKMVFFDSKKVKSSVDKTTRAVLSRFGAFVRRTARGSIRSRKRPSRPGRPPSNRTGLLKRFIFFGYETDSKSVVIGPAKLNRSSNAPQVLEHGGKTKVTAGKETKRVKIAARPFMAPAFDKEKDKLPQMWKDSVK